MPSPSGAPTKPIFIMKNYEKTNPVNNPFSNFLSSKISNAQLKEVKGGNGEEDPGIVGTDDVIIQ